MSEEILVTRDGVELLPEERHLLDVPGHQLRDEVVSRIAAIAIQEDLEFAAILALLVNSYVIQMGDKLVPTSAVGDIEIPAEEDEPAEAA